MSIQQSSKRSRNALWILLNIALVGCQIVSAQTAPDRNSARRGNGLIPPAAQIQEQIQEATLDEPEGRAIGATPATACRPRPRVITIGRPDEFAPTGSEPIYVSPTARAIWGNRLVPFDHAGSDRIFATSINLGQCKLCGQRVITVELKVKRNAGLVNNDKVYLHFSNGTPNNGGLSPAIVVKDIWQGDPPTLTTKVITLQVPLATANQYIFNNNMAFLDVVVQDDTAVDYVRFSW